METIKIYHSPWRMLFLAFACIIFVVGSVFMLEHTKDVFHVVVAWIGIAFFGLGGLYMLYATLKERLTGKPFLTITDDRIISEGLKQTVIHFSDVESFDVVNMRKQQFVAVNSQFRAAPGDAVCVPAGDDNQVTVPRGQLLRRDHRTAQKIV